MAHSKTNLLTGRVASTAAGRVASTAAGLAWVALLGLAACSDSAGSNLVQGDLGVAAGGSGGTSPPLGGTEGGTVVPPTGGTPDAGPTVDVGVGGAGDATPFLDLGGGPPIECQDADCGPGQVCYQGSCVDGSRCSDDNPCPGGRLCVDGVCLGDPAAAGGLVAEPDTLFFSYAAIGESVRYGTTLTNKGNDNINVTALNFVGSPLFHVFEPVPLPLRLVPEQDFEVLIELIPDDAVPEQAVLQIVTDQPGAPPVEVRLQSDHKIIGGSEPCLQISPAQANFGAVVRGDVGHRPVDLISCGDAPVTVTRVDRGATFLGNLSEHFDIGNRPQLPLTIQPAQRVTLDMTYTPGRAGLEGGFWDVRSNDRATPAQRIDVSAMAAPPPLEDVGLHIRVAWNTDLTDVDTHVLAPGGEMWTCEGDCFFSNPNPNWGDQLRWEDDPFLDVDDVDGFGPENVNIQDPIPGTYTVLIHYYDTHDGNEPDVTVEVLSFDNPVGNYGPEHLRSVDDVWHVVEIDWPGPVLREIGGVANEDRAAGGMCGGFGF